MNTPILALSDAIALATELTPQDFSVSIGRWNDRSTWRVTFIGAASDEQTKGADSVLASFDPASVIEEPPRDLAAELDALKQALITNAVITEAEVTAIEAKPISLG